jgi:DNA repair protein RecN (Recombination protein N)
LESLGAEYADYNRRIDELTTETQDLSYEMSRKNDAVEVNPALTDQLNERLDLLFSLQNKYHVEDNAALILLLQNLQQEVSTYTDEKEKLAEYQTTVTRLEEEAQALAVQLSESRKAAVPALVRAMEARLHQLGMAGGRFAVTIEEGEELRETGHDTATFLFSANAGVAPADIARIASGGEMSRIMLCLKSIITDSMYLPTIIFDEIDTGVSGKTAEKMADIMREMGRHGRQVISITHLPQIAALGSTHYRVSKQETATGTVSNMTLLTDEERTAEIAQMLSGSNVTEAALENARQLLKLRHNET